jgi:hypothetical protein
MKAFMINDNLHEQQWFARVLAEANQQHVDDTIELGWGDDADKATASSVTGQNIFDALMEENAIYIVDLNLGESDAEAAGLDRLLRTSHESWAVRASEQYHMLRDRGRDHLSDVCASHPIASMVLLASRLRHSPTILTSNEGKGSRIAAIREANWALDYWALFPRENPAQLSESEVGEIIKVWANRLLSLLDPLRQLCRHTKSWFKSNPDNGWRYDRDGLPHNLVGGALADLVGHELCFRRAFRWLPEKVGWWRSQEQALAFHEVLKHSVGHHASWMGIGKRNPFPLGGAYLLLLIAIGRRFPNKVEPWCQIDWTRFIEHGLPISFLPSQELEDAERAVRCLFEFFSEVVVLKVPAASLPELGVSDIKVPEPGQRAFEVSLAWSTSQIEKFIADLRKEFI